MQGSSGRADVENGLQTQAGKRESGDEWRKEYNRYTLQGVRWIAGEKFLCRAQLALCGDLEGWDGGRGREAGREGDV